VSTTARALDQLRDAGPEDWQILRALCAYRLLLVATLLAIYYSHYVPGLLGQSAPLLFQVAGFAYGLVGVALIVPLIFRTPALLWQAWLQFGSDVLNIMLLVYSCDGVGSGLGMLLITPVVGLSLVVGRRHSLALASLGALALLGEEVYRQLGDAISVAAFTQAGFQGAVFLLTGLLANAVAVRARRSEAQAARVGSELVSLARLNEKVVEVLNMGVIVVDEMRRIRMINDAAKRMLQVRHGAIGRLLVEESPALAQALQEWEAGVEIELDPIVPAPEATEVVPRFSRLGWAENAPLLILLEDAARLREQAQQMKLAALGRLSASIAHEIRNPLSAISHAEQLLAESAALVGEDRHLLSMIHRHANRIDKIVRDVLALSRRDLAMPNVIALKGWLEGTLQQYHESLAHQPRPVLLGDVPEHLRIRFDPSHLQQVLYNLWDNAFEHGGRDATPVKVSVRAARETDGARPYLDVVDTGPGVPPPLVEQIFEPFFTTGHQGTGLGLYLARELCEYNQARLSYLPNPEGGACFRMLLTEVSE
jgi:two-component system, NtrC family, sensor histidine kinase PilS